MHRADYLVADMRIGDEERRRRLVARHHLGKTAGDGAEATRGVAALHSSDPITPYLATRARVGGMTTADLDRLLFEERRLWRMHAMRRTLFVVAAEEVSVFEAGAARAVARRERKRLEGWLAAEMPPDLVGDWLEAVSERILAAIARHGELRTSEVVAEVPEAGRTIVVGSGRWTSSTPVSSRLLFLLAMEGHLVRTRPAGSWRSSQYAWATVSGWGHDHVGTLSEDEGRAAIADRYLATHGPATMTDLRWWTGWTAQQTRRALSSLDVVDVVLDSGAEALVLADDIAAVDPPARAAAFLPGLDPTPMGWKERDWYLGPHGSRVFDRNGNAGPTVWLDGRIVGGWAQRPDGTVVYESLEEVDADGLVRIEAEADDLTAWMDGVVATPRFRTPLERELSS